MTSRGVVNMSKFVFKALQQTQVRETYLDAADSTPSYISTLASPMRKRHKDNLLVTKPKVIESSHFIDYSIFL